MNIVVIGSGGREHAIVKAIARSASVDKLYAVKGSDAIAREAECVDLPLVEPFAELVDFCKERAIDLAVIGPEAPLVDGITDALEGAGIVTFGPSKYAAQIEGSKIFMKEAVAHAGIPTAAFATFDDEEKAKDFIRKQGAPIVVKTDGLAAGKGVTVAMTEDDALEAVRSFFAGKFGDAGRKVVIEEYLQGRELSFFAICDGTRAVAFGSAQDHKRAYDGDKGPNTGGMGTYSPSPIVTPELEREIMNECITPLLREMEERGHPYKGFLFAGLMVTKNGVKLIEYNIRLGDPETQVILPRFEGDFAQLLHDAARGQLGTQEAHFAQDMHALCVIMAAKGYPEEYDKGEIISGLEEAQGDGVIIYHAGTKRKGDEWLSNGGRVLGITGIGSTLEEAKKVAYGAAAKVKWEGGFFRKDIGE